MLYLDILDIYQRSSLGKKVHAWNRRVTLRSRVGSEHTFGNLVETVLDQLKISMTFEISECLGSQYYQSLLNLFLIKICSF